MVTIAGERGFIGSRVRQCFETRGIDSRGWVVWCAGVTGDFRSRPYDTVEAHAAAVSRLLESQRPEGIVYLSSTRVYSAHSGVTDESAPVVLRPDDPEDLYTVSKAMGEAICLASGGAAVILRLSHVYGPGDESPNFLASLVRDAVTGGHVALRVAATSRRDFVHVDVVVDAIASATGRREREIYNVASGSTVEVGAVAERLRELTGCSVSYADVAPIVGAPEIDVTKARRALAISSSDVLGDLPAVIEASRARSGRAR